MTKFYQKTKYWAYANEARDSILDVDDDDGQSWSIITPYLDKYTTENINQGAEIEHGNTNQILLIYIIVKTYSCWYGRLKKYYILTTWSGILSGVILTSRLHWSPSNIDLTGHFLGE